MTFVRMTFVRRNPATRYSDQKIHNHYGIVNWLKKKKLCFRKDGHFDENQYLCLLLIFCALNKFPQKKDSLKSERFRQEAFIQERFSQFCHFAMRFKDPKVMNPCRLCNLMKSAKGEVDIEAFALKHGISKEQSEKIIVASQYML